jgi:hypothetical protein
VDDKPRIFETMHFVSGHEAPQEILYFATLEDAQAGHEKLVQELRQPLEEPFTMEATVKGFEGEYPAKS